MGFRCNTAKSAKAAYRLLSNEAVKTADVLAAHRPVIIERVKQCSTDILVIQDTTFIVTGEKAGNDQLGVVSHVKGHPLKGIMLHTSLVVGLDNVPCGIIDQIHLDHGEASGKKKEAFEERESMRWVESLRKTHEFLPNAITVADRECDFKEFMSEAIALNARFVIRAKHDRKTGEFHTKLSEVLSEQAIRGQVNCTIERKGKQESVRFDVKYTQVTFANGEKEDLTTNILHVMEQGSGEEGKKLSWVLLTNLPLGSLKSAVQVIEIYRKRWHIENFHKALKTGYEVEKAKLENRASLERLFITQSICAARVYYLQWAARNEPDRNCEVILTVHEWRAAYVLHQALPPKFAPTIGAVMLLIAKLGGYLNRKSDGPPGLKVIWRGLVLVEGAAMAISALEQLNLLNFSRNVGNG